MLCTSELSEIPFDLATEIEDFVNRAIKLSLLELDTNPQGDLAKNIIRPIDILFN
jgi:hypothetical protein